MSRLTVRLPESLHERLALEARREGVSLNQYVVYSLTRSITARELDLQRETFDRLTHRYSDEEAEEALATVLASRS